MSFKIAVVEIAGRQYQVSPDQEILVNFLGDIKNFSVDKVLMLVSDRGIEIGTPYLKTSLDFEVIRQTKDRIRVATYHAKANTRRVKGARIKNTVIKLVGSKEISKIKKAQPKFEGKVKKDVK